MTVHVNVSRGDKENNMSVLRRFRQKVTEWAGVRKVKKTRYYSRTKSTYVQKKNRLRAIEHKVERQKLYKMGAIDRV